MRVPTSGQLSRVGLVQLAVSCSSPTKLCHQDLQIQLFRLPNSRSTIALVNAVIHKRMLKINAASDELLHQPLLKTDSL